MVAAGSAGRPAGSCFIYLSSNPFSPGASLVTMNGMEGNGRTFSFIDTLIESINTRTTHEYRSVAAYWLFLFFFLRLKKRSCINFSWVLVFFGGK